MTYVEALEIAIGAVDSETAEKLVALKGQIAKKKGSSKPTKTQIANEGVKDAILAVLGDAEAPLTVGEIVKVMDGEYTSQKISALCRQLVASGKVEKAIEKKVSRFSLA